MKITTLAFLALCSVCRAQQPLAPVPPSAPVRAAEADPSPANYVLTLTAEDKAKPDTDVSLASAGGSFQTSFSDGVHQYFTSFSGSLAPWANGLVFVQYNGNSVHGSVVLRPGAPPFEIFKTGDRSYKLSISRIPAAESQSK